MSFILLVVEIFDCLEVDKGVDGFVTSLVVCPEVECYSKFNIVIRDQIIHLFIATLNWVRHWVTPSVKAAYKPTVPSATAL